MKKTIAWILLFALALTFTGCAEKTGSQGGAEGTTAQIVDKIYENHEKMELYVDTLELDLADDNAVSYNTGLSSGEKLTQGSISEASSSQAYSLAVLRVKDATDAAQVAKDVYDNINTRKWICVEADVKTVAYSGDLVMLYMVSSELTGAPTAQSIQEAFRTVCGGKITVVG